jgi:hypothetical protein
MMAADGWYATLLGELGLLYLLGNGRAGTKQSES